MKDSVRALSAVWQFWLQLSSCCSSPLPAPEHEGDHKRTWLNTYCTVHTTLEWSKRDLSPTATGECHCRGKALSMWGHSGWMQGCGGSVYSTVCTAHRAGLRAHTTTHTHLHHSLSRALPTKFHINPPAVDQQNRTYIHVRTDSYSQVSLVTRPTSRYSMRAERDKNKLGLAARLQPRARYPTTTKATMQQLLQLTLTRVPYSVHTQEATKYLTQWE